MLYDGITESLYKTVLRGSVKYILLALEPWCLLLFCCLNLRSSRMITMWISNTTVGNTAYNCQYFLIVKWLPGIDDLPLI